MSPSIKSSTPITDALREQGVFEPSTYHWLPWRADGKAILVQRETVPSECDPEIGRMDTDRLAGEVVMAHNAVLAKVQRSDFFEFEDES